MRDVPHLRWVGAFVGLTLATGITDQARAQWALAPGFQSDYALVNLGAPPGVPVPFGGITMKRGTTDRMLIGGLANDPNGAIFEIGITRDAQGHISGYSGVATKFANAPNIDGGLDYAPNGTLFYTAYPNNTIGQVLIGGIAPDRTIDVSTHGVGSSVGSLAFVPEGWSGAGRLKVASYSLNVLYDVPITLDPISGLYTFEAATLEGSLDGGPEGLAYVPGGSPGFPQPAMLVSQYAAGKVVAYDVGPTGAPIAGSEREFVTGLTGAEGAAFDRSSGDFLFSMFGGTDSVFVVSGFAAVPEPAAWGFGMLVCLAGFAVLRRFHSR